MTENKKSVKECPTEITPCYLEVVVMPNGEILSLGKTIGWYKDYAKYLVFLRPDILKPRKDEERV